MLYFQLNIGKNSGLIKYFTVYKSRGRKLQRHVKCIVLVMQCVYRFLLTSLN